MSFNDPDEPCHKLSDGTRKPVTDVHAALKLLKRGLRGSVNNILHLRASEGAEAYISREFPHSQCGDPTYERFAIGLDLVEA